MSELTMQELGEPQTKPLEHNGNNDYTLNEGNHTVWITVGNVSVWVVRYEDRVRVGLYPRGAEDETLAETVATFEDSASEGGKFIEEDEDDLSTIGEPS